MGAERIFFQLTTEGPKGSAGSSSFIFLHKSYRYYFSANCLSLGIQMHDVWTYGKMGLMASTGNFRANSVNLWTGSYIFILKLKSCPHLAIGQLFVQIHLKFFG